MINKLAIIAILLFMSSCLNNSSKQENTKDSFSLEKKGEQVEKAGLLKISFPDTVDLKKIIDGKLTYNANEGEDIGDFEERYIYLHILTNKTQEEIPLKEINKFKKQLVYEDATGDGKFDFQAVFTEKGENYLHGVIEDIIVISKNREDGNVEVSKQEITVTKKIYVK